LRPAIQNVLRIEFAVPPIYFVSSVGIDEETIKRYVEHQGNQDSGQFRMELKQ